MKDDRYTIIYVGEHGDVSVEELSKDELLKRVNERHYGDLQTEDFWSKAPTVPDTNGWQNKRALVIKGSVVRPTAKAHVVEYEIE